MLPLSRPRSHRMSTVIARLLTTLSLATLGACSGDMPTAPASSGRGTSVLASQMTSTTEEPATGPWARIVRGETGPGSLYEIYVPREWNGDLVTIAHGFRDAAVPVSANTESYMGTLRDDLGAGGYAVAYSSYSENGFAVKDGAQRTHQLHGLAASHLGRQPERSFLVGFSLGGAVALSLAEQYPTQYDGALLACGMVGGSLTQTQYLGHVRVLFDAAYPGVLAGNVLGVPFNYTPSPVAIQTAVVPNLAPLFAIASTRQAPLPWVPGASAVPTMLQSLITALTFHSRGINNITDLVNDKTPYGNAGEVYTLGSPAILSPATLSFLIGQLDAGSARYTISAAAQQYLSHYYTPTGNLGTKVVTLHNAWDPVVPVFHEDSLTAAVTRAGRTDNLVQRRLPAYGHCDFSGAALLTAFGELEQWSRSGVKP